MRENLDIDTKTLAYYAWDHFAYHAQQRQTVFNFFLLLGGGCVAAYSAMIVQERSPTTAIAIAFWELSWRWRACCSGVSTKEMRGL